MPTYHPKPADIRRAWHVVDADGVVLGRLASEVAQVLRGKHKPIYAPNVDVGDHVVVLNAAKVVLTGEKAGQKVYHRHTGYPGGIRTRRYEEVLERWPDRVVTAAVRGMLPKGRLGRRMLKKLHVYAGPEHPHAAQQPKPLTLAHARRGGE